MHIVVGNEEIDGGQYKFDCEEQPKFVGENSSKILATKEDVDLLGLGAGICILEFLIFNYFYIQINRKVTTCVYELFLFYINYMSYLAMLYKSKPIMF